MYTVYFIHIYLYDYVNIYKYILANKHLQLKLFGIAKLCIISHLLMPLNLQLQKLQVAMTRL